MSLALHFISRTQHRQLRKNIDSRYSNLWIVVEHITLIQMINKQKFMIVKIFWIASTPAVPQKSSYSLYPYLFILWIQDTIVNFPGPQICYRKFSRWHLLHSELQQKISGLNMSYITPLDNSNTVFYDSKILSGFFAAKQTKGEFLLS